MAASCRAGSVASFKVMDVLARASELERQGRSIMHLEVGQPQTGAPQAALDAAAAALGNDRIAYTEALGRLSLRQRISKHYAERYSVEVPPERIAITTGSSGAFLLAFLAAFDAGDRVAVASASYPCYRNILNSLGCKVVTIQINSESKVTAAELATFLDKEERLRNTDSDSPIAPLAPLKGIILSSPSNPTGAMLTEQELQDMAQLCEERGVLFISDEIYHGICFEGSKSETALKYSSSCIAINSFSKYYSMTGWRLGWMVVPNHLVDPVKRLAQNLYINAPTLSQIAGTAAFDCTAELEQHIHKYAENRRILLQGLSDMGLTKVAPSNGAFYLYIDTSDAVPDSVHMASDLVENGGVAATPGIDFEDPASGVGKSRLRLSFCGATADMHEAVARMKAWWPAYREQHGHKPS